MGVFLFKGKIDIDKVVLILFILIKLIISFFPVEYGIFRDEFYYLAMSENLDFGYLDVPPLAPLLLAFVRLFFGVSYFSLHLLPAISGCLILCLSYLIVKKLNGGIFAVVLTLSCITFAPQFVAFGSFYSYDYLDQFFWILTLFTIVLLLKSENKKYWIYFGVAAGFGLLSKITILYLGFGIFLALILTKNRKYLLTWQFWIGGIIAFLIFSPYIIWHISKDMIVMDYYKNYASGKAAGTNPFDFLSNHIITLNPLTLPVWLSGFFYFLFNREVKKYNLISIAFIIVSAVSILTKTKYYLVTPFFPLLFAGGAVFIESIILKKQEKYILAAGRIYSSFIILGGLFIVPLARPVIPAESYIKLSNMIKLDKQVKVENHKLSLLPQFYADRFGWEEMVVKIKEAYDTLTDDEKKKCAIIVGNYGEAGAIEYYGKKYNLPKPVSGHLQYYIWGDRGHTGEAAIILGWKKEDVQIAYDEVIQTGEIYHKYAMPYENNQPVYVCRKLKIPFEKILKKIKNFS